MNQSLNGFVSGKDDSNAAPEFSHASNCSGGELTIGCTFLLIVLIRDKDGMNFDEPALTYREILEYWIDRMHGMPRAVMRRL